VTLQFDVHRARLSGGSGTPSFLVNLQSDLLNIGPTVVVAPLWPVAARRTRPPVSVRIAFQGQEYWLVLTDIAYLRVKDPGRAEGSIEQEREHIIRGLDLLFTGI
jgi:hypothetical protein